MFGDVKTEDVHDVNREVLDDSESTEDFTEETWFDNSYLQPMLLVLCGVGRVSNSDESCLVFRHIGRLKVMDIYIHMA